MLKRTFNKRMQAMFARCFSAANSKKKFQPSLNIEYLTGQQTLVKNTQDVELRGIKLKGRSEDLPTMIFFPDLLDQAENWLNFFINAPNSPLEFRDIYIVYPRNFGSSDWCNEISAEPAIDLADDVERFMYANKITMATLAGHGFGARNAMLTACYKPHLVTGVLAYDYAPQDYTYFRASKMYHESIQKVSKIEGLQKMSYDRFSDHLEDLVQSPKLRAMFEQNFTLKKSGVRGMNFNMDFVLERFDDLINWKMVYGIYGGRARFIFPEYSHYVFLNSNTLSMMKICVQLGAFYEDINSLFCDNNDNPEDNHWIYENPLLTHQAAFRTCDFLQRYDGVNVLLKSRIELAEKYPIQAIRLERKDEYAGLYVPGHVHHNWRFQNNEALK